MAGFARLRHRMKVPDFLVVPQIVTPGVSGRSQRDVFADGSADHRDILIYGGNAAITDSHVDFAVIAKAGGGLAGDGVQGNQPASRT